MEERIATLEPGLRAAVRALLVLVLTDDVRIYLGNHDRKAYEQAWAALELVLPGILHYYRALDLCRRGYEGLTVGLEGKVWAGQDLVGEFEQGTPELRWFRSHQIEEKKDE